MPTNERPGATGGQPYTTPGERTQNDPTDGIDDVDERLEHASWERFEASPGRPRPDRDDEAPAEHGAVVTFLEDQLRRRPLPTLIAAVAAGWLVGKLLR